MVKTEEDSKDCFVAEFGLKTEKWQEDLFEKRIFPHNDEFQTAVNRHMIKWFGGLFKDEQFRISWGFPYALQKKTALEKVKEKIDKLKADGKVLEKNDEDFLKDFDVRHAEICDEISKCMEIYGKNLSEKEVNKKCRSYCRAHASSTILNEKYVKLGRKPTQFSKMGLESLAGNIRTYELDNSGQPFENGGVTIGIARGCGDRAWAAWNRKINDFKSWGTKIFIKLESVGDSISFQSAMNCVLYPSEQKIKLCFKGLKGENYEMLLPLLIGKDDVYRQRVIANATEPLAVNVIRKAFGHKWRYFVQITFEGTPPHKNIQVGKGKVGIDMGPGGFTMYCSENGNVIKRSFSELMKITARIKEVQAKMSRSDFINNPDNYDENGTAKRGSKNIHSHNYHKLNMELKSLKRRAREFIKNAEGFTINHEILPTGDFFIVEKTEPAPWAKRRKVGVGKNGKKKRHGKSVAQFAPAEFVKRLKQSSEQSGATFREVSTKIAATQFDPFTNTFTKREEGERSFEINGEVVDRDAIAAFNLSHVKDSSNVDASETKSKKTKDSDEGILKNPNNYDGSMAVAEWDKFVEAQKLLCKHS